MGENLMFKFLKPHGENIHVCSRVAKGGTGWGGGSGPGEESGGQHILFHS